MRAPLILAAALALSACANNDQHDNTQNVDENLTAENIVSNDVTAIDAVTGDAANMAADVALTNLPEPGNNASEGGAAAKPKPAAKPVAAKPAKPEPATNTAALAGNTTE